MAAQIEITAVYLGERFRFANADGDTIIAEAKIVDGERPDGVNGRATIKGVADADALEFQSTYRFFGRWTEYTNRRTGATEQQFAFTSFAEAVPVERQGIIEYLRKHGEGCGIGQRRAERMWELFGDDAVRVAREEPDRVAAEIGGVARDGAHELARRLEKNAHNERCQIELVELLARRGFPKQTANRAMDLWGIAAPGLIRRDPYKLMQLRGCGFAKTDQMYLSLGLPPERLKRQALCAWYAIASATQSTGDTWTAATVAVAAINGRIGGADPQPAKAIKLAVRAGLLATKRTDGLAGPFVDQGGQLWLAESTKAANETYIARHLADAAEETPRWPAVPAVGVTEHQQAALRAATAGVIGILNGSPGTGKTFSAAAIIQAIIAEHGADAVAACAPTGKAAVRLTEALAGYGIELRSRTIHSTLGVDPFSATSGGGWRFVHNERNPLPARFLVVDEASMIDADLFASLLRARAAGTHMLIIGDVNQLLPVGHGGPLRDMIEAGLPRGELREIRRNSGMIVEACAAMRDGQAFVTHDRLDESRNLCMNGSSAGPEHQKREMIDYLRRLAASGFDPVWDCQILAAVNAKSPLSRRELNKILQAELNSQPGIEGSPFRVGDKVVNTKNGYFCDASGERSDIDGRFVEHYVANGEIGHVVAVEPKSFIVSLDTPDRTVRVPRGKAKDDDGDDGDSASGDSDDARAPQTGCSWDLAYALSTHKSQGSEFPVVIVMLDDYPGARRVCDRAWLYTAISRAKKLCVLIGQEATAQRMVRVNRIGERRTFLAELYRRERVRDLLAGM